MAIRTELGNYVKFLRGTPNAYSQLSPKDSDTLYFVSEQNADRGVLYLGEKLISGSLTASTTLADLTDVLINAGVEAGSLLFFDGEQWVDKSLDEIFEIIVGPMTGATAYRDGKTGLVPVPTAGQQSFYLRGDGTWADPVATLNNKVTLLTTQVGTLIGNDTDKSVRTIAQEEVAKIVNGAPEAFDTLSEIAQYLQDHPTETDIANRISSLEHTVYDSNTGLVDVVGVMQSTVGNLDRALYDLQNTVDAHDTQITNINVALQALKWQDLIIT